MAASNGADIVVCTLLMSTFAAFAFPSSYIAVRSLHLPISLAAGVCVGVLAGVLCSLRLIWRTAQQHAAAMLLIGQALAFLGCAGCYATLSEPHQALVFHGSCASADQVSLRLLWGIMPGLAGHGFHYGQPLGCPPAQASHIAW